MGLLLRLMLIVASTCSIDSTVQCSRSKRIWRSNWPTPTERLSRASSQTRWYSSTVMRGVKNRQPIQR